ncbi:MULTISPECIES: FG-GAP repeat domain-containing protein [unclassified Nocardia]
MKPVPFTRRAVTVGMALSAVVVLGAGPAAAGPLSFTEPRFFDSASGVLWDVTTGDFNNDGRPDIATAEALQLGWGGISVLMNDTAAGGVDARFGPATQLPSGPFTSGIAAADFNADGTLDLASANTGTVNDGGVAVFANRTPDHAMTARFDAARTFTGGLGATQIEAGDVTGDGKPDLVIGNALNVVVANVQVLVNTTQAGAAEISFSGPFSFDGGFVAEGLSITDVNADAKPDLIVGQTFSSQVSVLVNDTPAGAEQPVFRTHHLISPLANSVATGDFDGDGMPDIAAALSLGTPLGGVMVMTNHTPDGAATPVFPDMFSGAAVFGTGLVPEYVVTADFDGDGRLDLATANDGSVQGLPGGISILRNDTTPGAATVTFAPARQLPGGTLNNALATADFNSDGRPDLVSAHALTILGTAGVAVHLNTTT